MLLLDTPHYRLKNGISFKRIQASERVLPDSPQIVGLKIRNNKPQRKEGEDLILFFGVGEFEAAEGGGLARLLVGPI